MLYNKKTIEIKIKSDSRIYTIENVSKIKISEDLYNPIAEMDIEIPGYKAGSGLDLTHLKKDDIIQSCIIKTFDVQLNNSEDIGYLKENKKAQLHYENFVIDSISDDSPFVIHAKGILAKLQDIPFEEKFGNNADLKKIINKLFQTAKKNSVDININLSNSTNESSIDNFITKASGKKIIDKHPNFDVHNKSVYDVLRDLSYHKQFFMNNNHFYFMTTEKWSEKLKSRVTPAFRYGVNILSNNQMKYQDGDKNTSVKVNGSLGNKIYSQRPHSAVYPKKSFNNKGYKKVNLSLPNIKDEECLSIAKDIYNRKKEGEYQGWFDTFFQQKIYPGQRIYLENLYKKEKDGSPKLQLCEVKRIEIVADFSTSAQNKNFYMRIYPDRTWNDKNLKREARVNAINENQQYTKAQGLRNKNRQEIMPVKNKTTGKASYKAVNKQRNPYSEYSWTAETLHSPMDKPIKNEACTSSVSQSSEKINIELNKLTLRNKGLQKSKNIDKQASRVY